MGEDEPGLRSPRERYRVVFARARVEQVARVDMQAGETVVPIPDPFTFSILIRQACLTKDGVLKAEFRLIFG